MTEITEIQVLQRTGPKSWVLAKITPKNVGAKRFGQLRWHIAKRLRAHHQEASDQRIALACEAYLQARLR